jgi:two-component system CheB/CheR fusion protein
MSAAPLDLLLEYVQRTRGFDFSGYKRTSLERRIAKRMEEVGITDYVDYVDYLEVTPAEFQALFNTILINVTAFFRDPPTWDYVAADLLPPLLASLGEAEPVRVWCAGCASGEETYTVAILLAEAMGEEAFVERVKIYATDVDEEALDTARHAAYSAKDVENVPRQVVERYFEQVDQRYAFRKDLRRAVIFGRNDLVQDAPISRVDLLSCRNTLMYFNADTQGQILSRFNFALNDRGYLLLGKSEMLIRHAEFFRPVNVKRRVFRKIPRPTLRERLLTVSHQHHTDDAPEPAAALREGILDASPAAQIGVDEAGVLVMVNRRARELFHLARTDVGRPLRDLEISYRPLELRSHIETAVGERRTILVDGVAAPVATGDVRDLEVQIAPIISEDRVLGTAITFADVTRQHRVTQELETTRRELEHAYEELQSTVEELETTNEELQSTNEELETTNEELQSTNEELETMNEELQSTNQELETINDELRVRTMEVSEVNAFLDSILTSMGVAVVVVDRDRVVQVWNAHSADLWGLRSDEVEGHALLGLDIGLPLEALGPALTSVISGDEKRRELSLDARNRRGREITVRVTAMPLVMDPGDIAGAIVVMEQVDGVLAGRDGGSAD